MNRRIAWIGMLLFVGCSALPPRMASAEPPLEKPGGPRTWALIAVGLPGDADRAARHAEFVAAYEQWFHVVCQVPADRLLIVAGPAEKEGTPQPASAKSLDAAFTRLRQEMADADQLWVITVGHGSYDGRRAFFHVAGPDPPAEKWRQWLDSLPAARQTLWFTHATSGWFVPSLSRQNRIIVAATATDEEANETEFPRALAEVLNQSRERHAENPSARPSVADLFQATLAEVERLYAEDKRVPTEHAQLDDNGDGKGSEKLPDAPTPMQDGAEARQRHG